MCKTKILADIEKRGLLTGVSEPVTLPQCSKQPGSALNINEASTSVAMCRLN
jgi:hypothetical protein